jgi:glycosidase
MLYCKKKCGKTGIYFLLFLLACLRVWGHDKGKNPHRHTDGVTAEPPNWWIGMKQPGLQVILEAPGIAATRPELDYPGVRLDSIIPGDHPDYLFLHLEVGPDAAAGRVPFKMYVNEKGKKVLLYAFDYPLLARRRSPDSLIGFDASDVICLVTPDRFANGNPSNDRVEGMREQRVDRTQPYARHGGDLMGMIQRLPYLESMGFTALWPQPLLENDMPEASYHGYAITNHYRVDPRFGSLGEYVALADSLRARRMKLIFDGVLNHIGVHHRWVQKSPLEGWINRKSPLEISNHRRTIHHDPYGSKSDYAGMTRGWFVESMPDLNGRHPEVARYLIQHSIWWIETLGLGGIRQDTYSYSDSSLLSKWSCRIMEEYPRMSLVGEEWSLNPAITSRWQAHPGFKTAPAGGCLGSVMDFPLQASLVAGLTAPSRPDFSEGMARLYESLANDFLYRNPRQLVVFGDNHDMDRLFTQLNEDTALMYMAINYLSVVRGVPQWYYGTEVLTSNGHARGHHGHIRSDFPGGWLGDTVDAFRGLGLTASQRAAQAYMRALLRWRRQQTAIHYGGSLHFAPNDELYVLARTARRALVLLVMNRSRRPRLLEASDYDEVLLGRRLLQSAPTGDSVDWSRPITIPPMSSVIYFINPEK